MSTVRAALYLDFDNVFGGLLTLDPDTAIRFAESPRAWLTRLATSLTVDGARRWVVLRCYMNPAGWVPHPAPGRGTERLYFSRYRPHFTKAGFEVVDCPRLTHTKNAADIRLVVDAVAALGASTRYDEFVIASGDSDMTPLIVHLRAADRRISIVSPSDAADAFTSVADRLIDAQQVLALVQGEQSEEEVPEDSMLVEPLQLARTPDADGAALAAEGAFDLFRDEVTTRYLNSSGPLNLATLASGLRSVLGSDIIERRWFGQGFVGALHQLALPGARLSSHHLWDDTRHSAPEDLSGVQDDDRPEPVQKLSALLDLPRLPQGSWPSLYQTLAEYAATHRFTLTQATSWTRDRLTTQGVQVGRGAVGFVVRGASFGGAPLHRTPPPTADEIAVAFVDNLLDRADSAGIPFDPEEIGTIRTWLGLAKA